MIDQSIGPECEQELINPDCQFCCCTFAAAAVISLNSIAGAAFKRGRSSINADLDCSTAVVAALSKRNYED